GIRDWSVTGVQTCALPICDVSELLQKTDDRFVLFGPGDELDVRFEATKLPPVPKGWKRSYVLRTWGYCKDTGPFTAHGETVEPRSEERRVGKECRAREAPS